MLVIGLLGLPTYSIDLPIRMLVHTVIHGGELNMAACILRQLSRGIGFAAKCKGVCSYFYC